MDDILNDCACNVNSLNNQSYVQINTQNDVQSSKVILPVSSMPMFDEYSLIHTLAGVVAYIFLTHNTFKALAFHVLFEYAENNGFPFNKIDVTHVFNSNDYEYNGDSPANSFGDSLCFLIGFITIKYYNEYVFFKKNIKHFN